MNKTFHQLAPILALKHMPESFRAFFISGGYTEEQLKTDADLPDLVDHDNIENDPLCKHAHSYKMGEREGQLHWLDGDAIERIKSLAQDAHDFKAEGRLDMVRYCLGKMTHYRVDSLTGPHLHRGTPWSKFHADFETSLGKFLVRNQDKIGPIEFAAYDDIYKACRATAQDMWHKSLEHVKLLDAGKEIPDTEKLEICRRCIKGIGDLWLTIAKQLKL